MSDYKGMFTTNYGIIRNFKFILEEGTNKPNIGISCIGSENYGTVEKFMLESKDSLYGARGLTLGVRTNYGTIKNVYLYGKNIQAIYGIAGLNRDSAGLCITNNGNISNVYGLINVDTAGEIVSNNVGNLISNNNNGEAKNIYSIGYGENVYKTNGPTIYNVSNPNKIENIYYFADAIFNNCNFIGFQDTLYARLGNQMYYQCKIQGMTDFVFGEDSNVYLNSCDITCLNRNSSTNGGYICTSKPSVKPQVGFFFESCNIVGEQGVTPGTVSLARPWGNLSKITYANCNMDASISKKAYNDNVDNKNPRFDDMSSNLPQNADFSEYNNKGEGAITQAVLGGKILTQEEYNSLNGLVINLFSSLTD